MRHGGTGDTEDHTNPRAASLLADVDTWRRWSFGGVWEDDYPTSEEASAALRRVLNAVSDLLAELAAARTERDQAQELIGRQLGDCIGCSWDSGPEEECPHHGRTYMEWVEIVSTVVGREHALRAERDALAAKLEAVEKLHRKINLYEQCPDVNGCDSPHCGEGEYSGEYWHDDVIEGEACAECRDEEGDFIDWPCSTAAALSGVGGNPTPAVEEQP